MGSKTSNKKRPKKAYLIIWVSKQAKDWMNKFQKENPWLADGNLFKIEQVWGDKIKAKREFEMVNKDCFVLEEHELRMECHCPCSCTCPTGGEEQKNCPGHNKRCDCDF